MSSSYGRGVITQERGRFRVRVPDGRGGYVSMGVYDTRTEAEQMRAAGLAARATVGIGLTMRVWGDAWLHEIRDQRNIRAWRSTWSSVVLDAPFIDLPLDAITRPDLHEWTRALPTKRAKRSVLSGGERVTVETSKPISRQTAHHALGLVRRCLAEAVRRGHLAASPAEDARLPRARAEQDHGVTYLSAAEVESLLQHPALPLEQRTVYAIACYQGLREGEIAALTWERVELDRAEWTVAASWAPDAPTKTGSVRLQQLLAATVAALKAWHLHRGRPSRGLVFPSTHRAADGSLRPYAPGYDWGWADHPAHHVTRLGWRRRCGIAARVRFHDLRDTCATHLLSGTWGEPWRLEQVARHLGHTSSAVTERRYAHVTAQAMRLVADRTTATPAAHLPRAAESEAAEACGIIAALPAGVEPATNGLGSHGDASDSAHLTTSAAGSRQVRDLALDLLACVARGDAADEPARALALAVLADPSTALALRVLAGGPHALDRALDLAGRALDHASAEAPPKKKELSP